MKRFFALLLLWFALPVAATAATISCGEVTRDVGGLLSGTSSACICFGNCSATDLLNVVFRISGWIAGVSASAALLFIVIGGAMLTISGGSEPAIDRGKRIIRGAVFGLVIIFLAWVFVNFVVFALTGRTDGTIFDSDRWFEQVQSPSSSGSPFSKKLELRIIDCQQYRDDAQCNADPDCGWVRRAFADGRVEFSCEPF
jgi:hypothetical protein